MPELRLVLNPGTEGPLGMVAGTRFGMVTIRNLPPHRQPGYGGAGASAGTWGLILRYTCHKPRDVLVSRVAADRQAPESAPAPH
jgi:hypothetical protein